MPTAKTTSDNRDHLAMLSSANHLFLGCHSPSVESQITYADLRDYNFSYSLLIGLVSFTHNVHLPRHGCDTRTGHYVLLHLWQPKSLDMLPEDRRLMHAFRSKEVELGAVPAMV